MPIRLPAIRLPVAVVPSKKTPKEIGGDDVAVAVLVAAASVPEPSSLTLCGVAALISLGVALRHRSGVRSAGRLLLDRSRLHKK
ncbi:MAG: hypothetical protein WBX00_27165 [Isosphaeraceae bacterium]